MKVFNRGVGTLGATLHVSNREEFSKSRKSEGFALISKVSDPCGLAQKGRTPTESFTKYLTLRAREDVFSGELQLPPCEDAAPPFLPIYAHFRCIFAPPFPPTPLPRSFSHPFRSLHPKPSILIRYPIGQKGQFKATYSSFKVCTPNQAF